MSLLLRVLAVLLLLAALLDPVWRFSSGRHQVIVAVDVSSSVAADSLANVLEEIEGADTGSSDVGYIAFADSAVSASSIEELRRVPVRNSAAHSAASDAPSPPGGEDSRALDRSGTSLVAAIDEARSSFQPGTLRRLVIVSDGLETSGQALQRVMPLLNETIRVDAVVLPSRVPETRVLEGTFLHPPRARVAAPLELEIASPIARSVELTITAAGAAPARHRLELEQGLNTVPVEVRFQKPGAQELSIEIEENLAWHSVIDVATTPRVLVVGASTRNRALRTALQTQGWEVRATTPADLALDPRAWAPSGPMSSWDVIVLSNVDPEALGPQRMSGLSRWVADGGGLLFSSGDRTYGEDGYSGTPLEAILPLEFNVEEERTDVALMIALDKSYSMKGAKIELAKEATKAALSELDDKHRFGLVAFDWEPYDVVPLELAHNRDSMAASISRIEASAQTNFYPALESCLRQLVAVEADVKHVILLSDGKTYPDDYESLIRQMRESEITVSTVGVGTEADRELLADIARWGDGQTYFVQNAERVQRILLDEARGKLEETLVERPFQAQPVSIARALRGIDFRSAPALRGHLNLEPRDDAEVLLETDSNKPLLARRNVGLGRVWMFTSDLESRWSADWISWRGFGPLWSQVLHDASARRHPAPLDLQVRRERNRLVATLQALDDEGQFRNGLTAELRLRQGNSTDTVDLRQTAPGRYHAEHVIAPNPRESLVAELWIEGEQLETRSIFYPVPDELASGPADADLLQRLSDLTGGRFEPAIDQIFSAAEGSANHTAKLWPWLTGLALLLYLVELGLRRSGLLSRRTSHVQVIGLGATEPSASHAPSQAS